MPQSRVELNHSGLCHRLRNYAAHSQHPPAGRRDEYRQHEDDPQSWMKISWSLTAIGIFGLGKYLSVHHAATAIDEPCVSCIM
jgi:hypothetical protein